MTSLVLSAPKQTVLLLDRLKANMLQLGSTTLPFTAVCSSGLDLLEHLRGSDRQRIVRRRSHYPRESEDRLRHSLSCLFQCLLEPTVAPFRDGRLRVDR